MAEQPFSYLPEPARTLVRKAYRQVPADLRGVIDSIVSEFREHQRWAEAETLAAQVVPAPAAGFTAQETSHFVGSGR